MNGSAQQQAQRALSAALRYLSARDRTRHEVSCYLRKKGFSAQAVQDALMRLDQWGYLDDRRVALNWARNKMQESFWAKARVMGALERRGLEREIIQDLICHLDQELPEADLALKAARKYLRTHSKAGKDLSRRLAAYLCRRGFAPGIVARLIFKELGEDLGEEGSA